jgi:hypothetical protein
MVGIDLRFRHGWLQQKETEVKLIKLSPFGSSLLSNLTSEHTFNNKNAILIESHVSSLRQDTRRTHFVQLRNCSMSTNPALEAPRLTFEQLMSIVSEAVRKAIVTNPDITQSFSRIAERIEGYIRETKASGVTFPPAMLWELSQALQTLRDAPRRLEADRDKPKIDPALAHLLYLNYEHLKDRVGATEARKIISDFSSALGREPRGRPSELPLATLVKVKQLRDGGKSHGQIAIQLSLKREQVRNVLDYHYGEEKSD